jgi:hypothetical protein
MALVTARVALCGVRHLAFNAIPVRILPVNTFAVMQAFELAKKHANFFTMRNHRSVVFAVTTL